MPKKDGKKQDPKGRLLRGVFPHSSGLLYVLTLNEAEYNHGVWRAEHDCQGLYISHQQKDVCQYKGVIENQIL